MNRINMLIKSIKEIGLEYIELEDRVLLIDRNKKPNKNGWIVLNVFHSDWNWIMEVCIKLGMEFVTTNKKQLILIIYEISKTYTIMNKP